jgi:predicted RNase H-like nuclease (RuvC/YqgF family)
MYSSLYVKINRLYGHFKPLKRKVEKMDNKKFESLTKQCKELEKRLDRMVKSEDVTRLQSDYLSDLSQYISDKLRSFNQYEAE